MNAIIKLGLIATLLVSFVIWGYFATRGIFYIHSKQLIAQRWREYKAKYDLKFHLSDEINRLKIYRENMEFIRLFNEENHDFKLAENQFAHWSDEEYTKWIEENNKITFETGKSETLPGDIMKMGISDRDWRESGMVTAVKDQGNCGSSYAFSTTAAVESVIAIANGTLVDLSTQDIIDCSGEYGKDGCSGGSISRTFLYYRDIGVVPLSSYPYTAKAGKCLRPNMTTIVHAKVSSYVSLTPNDEIALATAISNLNPVSIAIYASLPTFKFYSHGVYKDMRCFTRYVNHGMTAIGIGSSPSEHYILKNSWGTSWGSQGYMLLARNQGNACGVASRPILPII